jgi:glycyl-tRNA synthetase alpha chain
MLDGTEITQFTYFQQVGGMDLSPISCEITYGMERIAMFLQKVDNVFDVEWGGGKRYGDVRLREEVEQSKYAFNQGTGIAAERYAEFHRHMFEETYRFSEDLLKAGLILPALEHCLKCSHLFNLLDSSGSVGVTERMAYILRVRKLSLAICQRYAGESANGGTPSGSAQGKPKVGG